MKVYPITELFAGNVALSPCPKGNEYLDEDIKWLADNNYTVVISMLTVEEQQCHGLTAEECLCNQYGIRYFNFPIRDDVADSDDETQRFVNAVVPLVYEVLAKSHNRVLFHCRGGVGRSSMMIALTMVRYGHSVDDIFTWVSSARGEQTPESDEQRQWVEKLVSVGKRDN